MNIIISIAVGILLAFLIVYGMAGNLKSVSAKHQADNYVIRSSVKIRNTFDRFVRKDVKKTAKPKQNS